MEKEVKELRPLFGFDLNKIEEFCENIDDPGEVIDYLQYVEKELINYYYPYIIPPKHLKLLGKIDNDIKYWEAKLETRLKFNKVNNESKSKKDIQLARWLGTEAQLVYLFQELVNAQFLPNNFFSTTGKGYKFIASLFANSNGKLFKNTQLAQAYQNLVNNKEKKPREAKRLDEIITEIKSL